MKHNVQRIIFVIVLALFALVATARAADIVFDPTNFGVNVEQVLHHLEEVTRLEEQIRNQLRMLENWRFTRLSELLASMQTIRQAIDATEALDIARRYPIVPRVYAQHDAQAMQILQQQWLQSQRATLVHAQTLSNRIVSEMPGTQRRVDEYVQRSNSAPGQTAVLQASNETLATLASQLQSLQALDLSQTRIELEEDAYRQAEETFHDQRRAALMQDWASAGAQVTAPISAASLFPGMGSK